MLGFRSGRLLVCKQAWRSNSSKAGKKVAASRESLIRYSIDAPTELCVSKWRKERKSFFLSPQLLHSHWPNKGCLEKTRQLSKYSVGPEAMEMSLYCPFISPFLSLTHFPHRTPPLSLTSVSFIFTIVVLLRLQPLRLSLLRSLVHCRSPHSACLQAVFLIFLNYSRHFLFSFFFFFFFFQVICTNLKPG